MDRGAPKAGARVVEARQVWDSVLRNEALECQGAQRSEWIYQSIPSAFTDWCPAGKNSCMYFFWLCQPLNCMCTLGCALWRSWFRCGCKKQHALFNCSSSLLTCVRYLHAYPEKNRKRIYVSDKGVQKIRNLLARSSSGSSEHV